MKKLSLKNSFSLWEKAVGLIPNGTQCFSKGTTQFSFGACPIYLKKGRGAKVIDVDGNEYIDYGMGLHSVILGYSHPKVSAAVKKAVDCGMNLTLMHPLEVEVAQILTRRIPSAEMVRFTKTGSEATAAAIRIARIATGRDHVAACGYHGWHDWFIGLSERAAGVPEAIKQMAHKFSYNQIDTLERLFADHKDKIAAVIMEPCGVIPPKDDFLKKCRQTAHRNGALFILDEMITGVRWNEGGAQALFKVVPDISTFGKSIANGAPLSAVVGKKRYMRLLDKPDVFFSSTFGGEVVSLAACSATLGVVEEEKVVPFIWKQGERFMAEFSKLVEKYNLNEFIEITGFPCRPVTIFKQNSREYDPLAVKTYIQQECVKRGLLFTGYFAMSLAHTDKVIDRSLDIFDDVLADFGKATTARAAGGLAGLLDGEVVSPVFRKL